MGIKIAAVLFVVMIAMTGAGGLYYKHTQARIATLTENNAKLEVAIKISEKSINILEEQAEVNAQRNLELQSKLQKSEEYGDQLRSTLQKHNLTNLADKKPNSIEKRMQNATDQLWDDFRDITDPNVVRKNTGDSDSN